MNVSFFTVTKQFTRNKFQNSTRHHNNYELGKTFKVLLELNFACMSFGGLWNI